MKLHHPFRLSTFDFRLLTSLLLCLLLIGCGRKQEQEPFPYYVGTNFWYGPILGSTGQGGDRERLARELDTLQALGITNLRVLVGADGLPGNVAKVTPCLQTAPGVYNDTILDGLDYFMAELGKRQMSAVLFLNNSWEWSGGYSEYLGWAKNMHWPTPQEVGYPTYMNSCAEWSRCQEAQELFFNHVRFIVSRTNRYTGLEYKDDPAIFSWQIGNEPRAFSDDVKPLFAEWIQRSAQLIKSIDPNHRVSTGSEGLWGCEGDSVLCEQIHAFPEIDYITCHIWPFNWKWLPDWQEKVQDYIDLHIRIAERIGKPLVIEEFGFPRDNGAIAIGTPTVGRDEIYNFVFRQLVENKHCGGMLHGCNFWGWGGEAKPLHAQWQPGDPYTGDPAQEDQGLNSVFLSDTSTIAIIRNANKELQPELFRADATLTVDAKHPGSDIASTMYGIFFEDINYGADGGLYADLVKNRSFEFADPLMGWQVQGQPVVMNDGPFEGNPHYLRLTAATTLENEGTFRMGFREGIDYHFSVWARSDKEATLSVSLTNVPEAKGQVVVNSPEWKKYTLTIPAGATTGNGALCLSYEGNTTLDIEHVSLFPSDAWNGILRADLVQALKDLHPGVFRFPGGCIVEGNTLATRYQWKNSVGQVENRPTNVNRWQNAMGNRLAPDYYQSYGLGFYEYFLLSEYLGAEPLPVLNAGMACEFANDPTTEGDWLVPMAEMQPYVDDALHLIEFANGDPKTSEWAALRAEMGHPKPFNLKYLAIGNEQWGEFFAPRLALFTEQIRAAYPDIQLVGTAGPSPEGEGYEAMWSDMRRLQVDLVDEHFYCSIPWFLKGAHRYDNFPRTGPKVFAGEYCCHAQGIAQSHNHFAAALAEAALMTGFERNADVVRMTTPAPLFAHVDGWQWQPDMIWFDNLTVCRPASYYVQQLFAAHAGTQVLPCSLALPEGKETLFATSALDQSTGKIILKLVNTSYNTQLVRLEGCSKERPATAWVLSSSDDEAENQLAQPEQVYPVSYALPSTSTIVVPARSLMVVER